ncbi:Fucose permease [Catalinimonas alkaloidigena]|uniref:Fucose permease n=1 Tax=Catalinimonas alkaloidigena TaxID=1075417 RepID=A0A1G9F9Y8_9BACT|nr:MFS transporter [Catalinimonas alkaloidigena]SDK85196.1 Fucose permease [Catalinimonas alkaloidigena]
MASEVVVATRHRRTHRMAVGAFFFLRGLIFASWASRIPQIQERLALSDGELGGVLLAMPAGMILGMPLSAWLVGRLGSHRLLAVGAPFYAVALLLIGMTQATWQLMGVLFLFGLSGNLYNIATNTQGVGVEALYGRSVMASFHGLWSLAGFLSALLGSYFISLELAITTHFAITSLTALVLMLAFHRYTLDEDASAHKNKPIFVRPDRTLLNLGAIAFCSMICEGTMFDWSGIYFTKVVGVPESMTALGYVAFMATMAGGRFFGDWLAMRLGVRRLIQVNGVLIALGLLTAVLLPYLPTAVAGFLLVGVGTSTIVPLVYGIAGKTTTMSTGMALTAVSSTGFLGFLFGPPLIGFISEIANLQWSFALVALLGLCSAWLISRVRLS